MDGEAATKAKQRRIVLALVGFVGACWALMALHGALWMFAPSLLVVDLFAIASVGLVAALPIVFLTHMAIPELEALGDPDDGLFNGSLVPVVMAVIPMALFATYGKSEASPDLGYAPHVAGGALCALWVAVLVRLRTGLHPVGLIAMLVVSLMWGAGAVDSLNALRYGPDETYETQIERSEMLGGLAGKPLSGYRITVGAKPPAKGTYTFKIRSPEVAPSTGSRVKMTIANGLLGYPLVRSVGIVK
jgi:hypothetical protein